MKTQIPGKAVFFDRDGVLNLCPAPGGKPRPPRDAESLIIAPEAPQALKQLAAAGFRLLCVTNQPDVARGSRTLENVLRMNDKVCASLPLDALYACLHDDADACGCRKPKPGMLLRGAAEYRLDLARCYMVGDRRGDILAGRDAGCATVFLDFNYSEPKAAADFCCASLAEAVAWMLAREKRIQAQASDDAPGCSKSGDERG